MVVNVITVHNCSTGRGTNNESDRESVCERTTQSIEETSIDMASDVDKIILQGIKYGQANPLQLVLKCI